MAANISQAEKWRRWKQKMQENDTSNCEEHACDKHGDCESWSGGVEHNTSHTATDTTLQMVQAFIEKCQNSSDNKHIETARMGVKTINKSPTPQNTRNPCSDGPSVKAPGYGNRTLIDITSNSSDCETNRSLGNRPLSPSKRISEVQLTGINKTLVGSSLDKGKDDDTIKGASKNNVSVKYRARKLGNTSNKTNEESSKRVNETSVTTKKGTEKSRRTVRFADSSTGKTDDVSTDKLDKGSVTDALQKEGRRIMVEYLAEYDSSSESSADEEVVQASGIHTRCPEDVRFTVHLSTSMKDIKPYRCVVFDVIETNKGKAYSASTGRFLAPQKGSYVFFLTTTASLNEQPELSIIHNFHPVDPSKIKTNKQTDGDMETKTEAILLSLERHDEIWLLNVTRLTHVKQLKDCHFLSFSGCFLNL